MSPVFLRSDHIITNMAACSRAEAVAIACMRKSQCAAPFCSADSTKVLCMLANGSHRNRRAHIICSTCHVRNRYVACYTYFAHARTWLDDDDDDESRRLLAKRRRRHSDVSTSRPRWFDGCWVVVGGVDAEWLLAQRIRNRVGHFGMAAH